MTFACVLMLDISAVWASDSRTNTISIPICFCLQCTHALCVCDVYGVDLTSPPVGSATRPMLLCSVLARILLIITSRHRAPSSLANCVYCLGMEPIYVSFFFVLAPKKKLNPQYSLSMQFDAHKKNEKNVCLNATIGCSGSIIYCWSNYCSIHYTARGRAGRSITRNVACQSSECEANKNEIEEE